jgi:hypothetical protein
MASSLPDTVVEKIKSSLELFPGLSASPATLATLLAHIKAEGCVILGGGTEANPKHTVRLGRVTHRDGSTLHMNVRPPYDNSDEHNYAAEHPLFMAEYTWTPDGLLEALVDAKERVADHRKRGFCPDCESLEPPLKRARAIGMPKCCSCVMATTVGL